MKHIGIITMASLAISVSAYTQELYVYTEPASNMPAHSISGKLTTSVLKEVASNKIKQRYAPEIMFGLDKKWMVHAIGTFSDMYTSGIRWESVRLYAKYRILSLDEVHQHFRMAAFAEVAHSTNEIKYQEVSLNGDQSGIMGGIIVTQLWHKLALSSTLGYTKVTTAKPSQKPEDYPRQALNYSLSAGYLVLPTSYLNYKQTNLNLYAELLGQQTPDRQQHYIDLAPAAQLIFNSNTKLNIGYRFQLSGNMHRMAEKGWQLSLEYIFLNALKKKRRLADKK